jgi:predicted glutamine amidotransferase
MCRLFGLLASPGTTADPWLLSSDCSLLAQSHASEETAQRDGWGIAWYENGRPPTVVKGTGGAFRPGDRERFESAARAARAPLVIGHLRHASNPMNLPPERLIGLENSQPFADGSVLFAHNGSIPFPRETRPRLGRWERQLQGVNDSEVLFYLLLRQLEVTGDPLAAYLGTIRELEAVAGAANGGDRSPFSGLNVLFARGPDELWAFCRWNGEHGSWLCHGDRPYYEMTYLAEPERLVVGSEPFDTSRPDWRPLHNGEYLHASRANGRVDLTVDRIAPRSPPTSSRRTASSAA